MALVKCRECSAKVSTKAKACPSCGAPLSTMTVTEATRSGCGFLVFLFFLLCAWAVWWSSTSLPPSRSEPRNNLFSVEDGSHPETVRLIKAKMNDPNSFEHVETRYRDKGKYLIVVCEFRGKNAFGGVITQKVRVKMWANGEVFDVSEFY
jgi:hypothetical protein